jgi:hypothetical protein
MENFHAAELELQKIESNCRLRDPRTATDELRRLVDEELQSRGMHIPKDDDSKARARIHAAARVFMEGRPEYAPTKGNERLMFQWIFANGMSGESVTHYELAFAELRNKLTERAPQKSLGPVVRKVNGVEISHSSLDQMSASEMARHMMNPAFVAAVKALPPRSRKRN